MGLGAGATTWYRVLARRVFAVYRTELARSYRVAAVPRMRTERALSLDACLVTFASVIMSTMTFSLLLDSILRTKDSGVRRLS